MGPFQPPALTAFDGTCDNPAMRPPRMVTLLAVVPLPVGCFAVSFGREVPSPEARTITIGRTDKVPRSGAWGEREHVGRDGGDPAGRRAHGRRRRRDAGSK